MSKSILYTRTMSHGPVVRIRRTSEPGVTPVVAVLEVDRRAGTPRQHQGGTPPPLLIVEGKSEVDVLAAIKPHADDDGAVARLLREKGQR